MQKKKIAKFRLERKEDGKFHCPCGEFARASTKNISNHVKNCTLAADIERAKQAQNLHDANQSSDTQQGTNQSPAPLINEASNQNEEEEEGEVEDEDVGVDMDETTYDGETQITQFSKTHLQRDRVYIIIYIYIFFIIIRQRLQC